MKLLVATATSAEGSGKDISGAFKRGPNAAHGASYGAVNKTINESIRETGSYTSLHSGTEYTKPGAGNCVSNGIRTRQ